MTRIFLLLLVVLLIFTSSASADSLFSVSDGGSDGNMDLYTTPNRALAVNDIIFVEVNDRSTAELSSEYKGKTEFSTDQTSDISNPNDVSIKKYLPNFIEALLSPLNLLFARDIKASHDKEMKGSGKTNSGGNLRFYLSAVVVEVLENGNLIIEGRRETNVNREKQIAVVRGMVRKEDINRKTNTVLAERIADCTVTYETHGDVTKRTRPGFLSQIFDILF